MHSVKSGRPTNRRIENPLYYLRQPTLSDNLQLALGSDGFLRRMVAQQSDW
jgi:hypothetical protein